MIDFEADAAAPAPAAPDTLKRLTGLVQALTSRMLEAAALDEKLKEAEQRIRQLSEEEIPELLRECGLSELRMEDGARVTVTDEIDCGISEERRPAAHAWLRGNDLGGVIKVVLAVQFGRDEQERATALRARLLEAGFAAEARETVHPQTLKATLRELRAAGGNVPAELFALRPFSKTKITYPPGVAAPPRPRKRA